MISSYLDIKETTRIIPGRFVTFFLRRRLGFLMIFDGGFLESFGEVFEN